jgi:hypothetical protein
MAGENIYCPAGCGDASASATPSGNAACWSGAYSAARCCAGAGGDASCWSGR